MPKIRTESQCFIGICKEDPPVVIKQMDINWKSQSLGEVLSILLETIWSTYVKVAFPTPISPSYLETCFQQSRNNLEDVAFSKAFWTISFPVFHSISLLMPPAPVGEKRHLLRSKWKGNWCYFISTWEGKASQLNHHR